MALVRASPRLLLALLLKHMYPPVKALRSLRVALVVRSDPLLPARMSYECLEGMVNDNAMMDIKKVSAQSLLAAVYGSFLLCICIQPGCDHDLVALLNFIAACYSQQYSPLCTHNCYNIQLGNLKDLLLAIKSTLCI
jgi:hypothetical protein